MAFFVRKKTFVLLVLPAVSGAMLWLGGVDLVPAWTAKSGGGTVGTFVAEREQCRRSSCSFYGKWQAGDESGTRADVILYDEPDGFGIGATVEATDTGARKGVFATGGGVTYLVVTGMMLAGTAGVVYSLVAMRKMWRQRTPRERRSDGKDLFTLP
jgi:hypothetical protein